MHQNDKKIFRVTDDFAGQTLVKWFRKNEVGIPHGLVQKLIRKKAILVNDKKADKDQVLEFGDVISLPSNVKHEKKDRTKKQKAERYLATEEDADKYLLSNIIYLDKNVIAINKPQGLATQGGSGVVLSVDDMLKFLNFDYKESPMLAHRLDKDTSGLLMLARTRIAANILGKGFKERLLKKKYIALVAGVPEKKQGRIAYPLAPRRAAGGVEKMAVDNEKGKIAVTEYKVLEQSKDGKVSLLELDPQTGRKHQIRAHLAEIGHPIVGDGKYGGTSSFVEGYGKNLHLHSWKISHKLNYFEGEIEAEIPDWLKNID